ncbi:hypothetical protein B0H10DRAFT_2218174 [Mycena sp. CBHHK59/15]|nr:hypothetical protein B0H10DRAFT_2218174 [Mycena sp. CBHHK59/15]
MTHEQFFDVISTNTIPGLYCLLSNAKKAGWSIEKTMEMALKALRGLYHPRSYTEFEKDLAILIYELGGGAALHALNKSPIMLPSRRAITEIRRNHSLRITVGNVTVSAFMENIEMLFRNTPVEGILINSVAINKSLIVGWLERMMGHDWSDESIHALLNPKDPQDVPRTIKLLCLVVEIRMVVDSTEFTPGELKTYRASCLLGKIFDAMVEPFINPTFSLSDQLIHLVKFAHLICAMFIKHESTFISNQLYRDLQCMVKNAIFTIAHSKILNPYLKVFLCLLGDDVLETLFGKSRMIGGHLPNMAIDEFHQRVGSALHMDEIFRKYPWLEHRARQLNMVCSRDVDHLSPEAWEGELTAGSCDIQACYKAGVAHAVIILESYGCSIDFEAWFASEDVDLMLPKGGKYPGVSKEVDRLMPDDSGPVDTDEDISRQSEVDNILNFDAAAALATEKAAHDAELAA